MKNLKTVTIWLVLAFIVLQHFFKISYYKHLISDDFYFQGNVRSVLSVSGVICAFLLDLLTLIPGIMSLGNGDKAAKERAYSMFRFVYIMRGFMVLPLVVFETIFYAEYMFKNPVTAFTIIFRHLIWITLLVFLIICKPGKQVQKVNLQEYDMVAFTSIGHRFAHYLLDILFLLPIWVFMMQFLMFLEREPVILQITFQFIFGTSYLLYCFLSEAIFRQTLGKMVTRSCVVSDGVNLSTGRILLRTLSRLIPFDAISFLFGAKWHDRASSTAVVYVDSWEKAFEDSKESI